MTSPSTIDEYSVLPIRDGVHEADPARPIRIRSAKLARSLAHGASADRVDAPPMAPPLGTAANRQNAQLPTFAPLLEELEVAGWSSHRRMLSGNFHDWLLLEGRTLLVMTGQSVPTQNTDAIDPIEAALVAQGAWASIRSHAHHACDAGTLLSLAAQSLWATANLDVHTAVAIALIDLDGGRASVAMAGDCMAIKVKATGTEQIANRQPVLGSAPSFTYLSHTVQLSLRERIMLVADEPRRRPDKLMAKVASTFSRLDAEAHRRMMAADAIALVREVYEGHADENGRGAASIVAVKRR